MLSGGPLEGVEKGRADRPPSGGGDGDETAPLPLVCSRCGKRLFAMVKEGGPWNPAYVTP